MSPAASRYSATVRTLFRELAGAGDPATGGGRLVSGEAAALDRGAWVRFAARIDLLQKADPSTFLHESAHFFFTLMGQLASAPNASEAIRRDYQTAVEWAGGTLDAPWYEPDVSREVYRQLVERACGSPRDAPVFLDANFPSAAMRASAVEQLHSAGWNTRLVWFDSPETNVRENLRRRAAQPGGESDADIAAYQKLAAMFEPPADPPCPMWRFAEMNPDSFARGLAEFLLREGGLLTRKV